MTWDGVMAILVVLFVGSIIACAVAAWWEGRKRYKK